ncbi:hypothetical protein [Nonomuraea sp. bgisy101]|uniref:hypothetical protein n=1 Tax=Nonomuraea sp. bgisy101 TaxID=3413784 RepID=UPI003D761937
MVELDQVQPISPDVLYEGDAAELFAKLLGPMAHVTEVLVLKRTSISTSTLGCDRHRVPHR